MSFSRSIAAYSRRRRVEYLRPILLFLADFPGEESDMMVRSERRSKHSRVDKHHIYIVTYTHLKNVQ